MGKELSLIWAVPFAGMLLSIALFPLVAPHFWHHHFRKISIGWALLLGVPFLAVHGHEAWISIVHTFLGDYVPFLILLWALFAVSGGILIRGTLVGKPTTNAGIMAVGTILASWIGTTGASMLLIRPLLRANEKRVHKMHTVVFFIFLVSNIGGCLTPLGDPPLFLGFLHGVDFFWTLTSLWLPMIVTASCVLAIYIAWDTIAYRREPLEAKIPPETREPFKIEGVHNFVLLGGVIAGVLVSGYWKPTDLQWGSLVKNGSLQVLSAGDHGANHADAKVADHKHADEKGHGHKHDDKHGDHGEAKQEGHAGHHGVEIPVQNITRDVILIAMGLLSVATTSKSIRQANGFSWFPIKEVAWLFAGIFMTIIPALAILSAGKEGAMEFLVTRVKEPIHYFWVTGLLSSVLDNAPTYLTFFSTALGQFHPGMDEASQVKALIANQNEYLVAISLGAVFMGANTYIGNAPNFMVKAIAEEADVRMPDFFSYILKYSLPVLGTTFILVTYLFFWRS